MIRAVLGIAAAAALMTSAVAAPAAPPKDVPPGHWASGSVDRVLQKKMMSADAAGKFNGNKPVTRYELAVALDRFVRYIEAGRKPLHPTSAKPVKVSPQKAGAAAARAIEHLTAGGFLPASSPLITQDGRKPATAKELTDALAQVTIRLSDRSLPPNPD